MTDEEVNYRAMARRAAATLASYRSGWEEAAPRLLPDYERVVQLLADFDAIGTKVTGTSSAGYTDARDRAENEAVAAAMRVVKSLRNVQLNRYRPELAQAAGSQRSELDKLRDENLVKALEAIAVAAAPVAAGLAQERVPEAALRALDKATDAYRLLVGTPRGQVLAGSALRTAFEAIDTRLDGLGEEDEFRAMVAQYQRARRLVNGGHGPHDAARPAAGS